MKKILNILILLLTINFANAFLETDIFSYQSFDINGTDLTGNGNDLTTPYSARLTIDGQINGGFNFDGNDYTTVNSYPYNFLHDGTSDWTISIWEKHSTSSTSSYGILGNTIGADRRGIFFAVKGQGVYFSIGRTTPYPVLNTGTAWENVLPSGNQYNHIVITYSPTADEMKLYVNGNQIENNVSRINPHQTGNAYYTSMQIGRLKPTMTYTYFNGNLDEFGVWKRVLSAEEIDDLYNNDIGIQYPFADLGGDLSIGQANLLIDGFFNGEFTNPIIHNNQKLYTSFETGFTLERTYNRYIDIGTKRYAIYYGENPGTNISEDNIFYSLELGSTNQNDLINQLEDLIDN